MLDVLQLVCVLLIHFLNSLGENLLKILAPPLGKGRPKKNCGEMLTRT